MKNYSNDNTARRYRAHVSLLGTTQIHLRNPYIVAWWSAAFPGFGHLLLSKYLRGFVLFIWEVIVNIQAHVNLAMIYSFQWEIDQAKAILDTRWLLAYIPVYIFGIWDSYRTTVDLNKVFVLAEREEHRFNSFSIGALEINYLDKRRPYMSFIWSLFIPGLGQLYIHRIVTAFFVIIWYVAFFYYSHALEAVSLLFLGEIEKATSVVNPEWLLFFPSLYGFAVFDSYMNTVENNKLYDKEQRKYFKDHYQSESFQLFNREKVDSTMQLISTFEHTVNIEMAVDTLEKKGIKKENIFVAPLDNRKEDRKLFDNIHRSDGVSLIDIGSALATAFAVIGASIGFKLSLGPIYWGLIGAFVGFVIGLAIRLYTEKVLKKKRRLLKGFHSELVLIVDCDEDQGEIVENILFGHYALGVAKLT